MKRIFCILFICLFLCGCSKDKESNKTLCLVKGCYNEVANNSAYCKEHLNIKADELYK